MIVWGGNINGAVALTGHRRWRFYGVTWGRWSLGFIVWAKGGRDG